MLEPGAVLQNRYEVIRTIGKGGMGAVYLARDTRLGHTVALKETFFTEDMMRLAFEREARLLAGLRHPVLPRVTDHFNENEGQFLVMEYIPGDDLAELSQARSGPFAAAEVMAWADQLLDALDYLHTREIPVVHRDIKPQNMKLTPRQQIILLDFGLAKGHAAGFTQTDGRSVFGYTPAYAPLEQIQGLGTDPRSDLYSLAATLYYFLTATPPADALMRATAILGGLPDPLRPAHELNPLLTPAISHILRQGLELHANQRPASAALWRQSWETARLNLRSPTDAQNPAPDTLLFDTAGTEAATLRLAAPVAAVSTANSASAPTLLAADCQCGPVPDAVPTSVPASEPTAAVRAAPTSVPASESTAAAKRWPLAAGGIAAAAVLGVTLWAAANRQPTVDNNNLLPAAANSPAGTNATRQEIPANTGNNSVQANSSTSAGVAPVKKADNPAPDTKGDAGKPPVNTTKKAPPASTPQPADATPAIVPPTPRRPGIMPLPLRVRRAINSRAGNN